MDTRYTPKTTWILHTVIIRRPIVHFLMSTTNLKVDPKPLRSKYNSLGKGEPEESGYLCNKILGSIRTNRDETVPLFFFLTKKWSLRDSEIPCTSISYQRTWRLKIRYRNWKCINKDEMKEAMKKDRFQGLTIWTIKNPWIFCKHDLQEQEYLSPLRLYKGLLHLLSRSR